MSSKNAEYIIRFKNGKFYSKRYGIQNFSSYDNAKLELEKKNITEDFELINAQEIECVKNNKNKLCIIWSKTKEIIWEKQ